VKSGDFSVGSHPREKREFYCRISSAWKAEISVKDVISAWVEDILV